MASIPERPGASQSPLVWLEVGSSSTHGEYVVMQRLDLNKIPLELKVRPQWVAHRPDKKPVNPKTGKLAKVDDPETWGTFSQAVEYYEAHKGKRIAGIGYMFSFYDPYAGIDLDKCRNPETGEIKEWAWEIIKRFNSYTEISPSGTGIHILIQGKLPSNAEHTRKMPDGGKIEVYDSLRYLTMTGNLI